MISPKKIQNTKNDLTLASTVMVVSNLIENKLGDIKLFNNDWKKLTVATLLGFTLYSLLTHKISSTINHTFKIYNNGLRKMIEDNIKYGTIFIFQNIFLLYIENKEIFFSKEWLLFSGFTLIGFSISNVIFENILPNNIFHREMIADLLRVSLGYILAVYIINNKIYKSNIITLFATLCGWIMFHLVTKKLNL